MTGPEHYREAERLVARAHRFTYGDGGNSGVGAALAAEAQVHAILALAAATALSAPLDGSGRRGMNLYVLQEWEAVAGIDEHPRGGGADE